MPEQRGWRQTAFRQKRTAGYLHREREREESFSEFAHSFSHRFSWMWVRRCAGEIVSRVGWIQHRYA